MHGFGLNKCEMPTRNNVKAASPHGMGGRPGSKDQQKKMDIFFEAYGVM